MGLENRYTIPSRLLVATTSSEPNVPFVRNKEINTANMQESITCAHNASGCVHKRVKNYNLSNKNVIYT